MPPVYIDPSKMQSVILNLVDNAIKFTPERGAITIRARKFQNNPKMALITVSDTGIGIPADDVDKIFTYLYQVKSSLEESRKGLGLGLYICKKLVDMHGGKIWVTSLEKKGSTFYVTVPLCENSKAENKTTD
jgi:two-component system phosphate regulon sensor histidine kinase PhoR